MAKTPVYMPKFGMTMVEAEITEWYVKQGQKVAKGDPLLSIETEKTTVDIEAPADGYITSLLFEESDSAEVGSILTYVADTEAEGNDAQAAAPQPAAAPAPVMKKEAPAASAAQPMPKLRRIIADNMRQSLQNSAQLTHFREVCVDTLADFKANQPSVSYNDLLLKAFGMAASQYKKARTQLVDGSLILKENIDVGLAVALDDGLIVPAIRGVDKLSLVQIASERKRVVEAARAGSLNPNDTGNCVGTLTNLGAQQIDGFTPILNAPESVILGIGRILEKPWVKNGQIVIAKVMTFSITFDHQVLDGLDAAVFLDTFVKVLDDPESMAR